MKKIIAIGGGEIGRPGQRPETTPIDREIIRLTGKKHPKLLFIPTASSDAEGYYQGVKKHFGQRLGCRTDVLYLLKAKPSKKEIKEKIMGADIVYVGGGNTLKMMNAWRRTGTDKILLAAWRQGIVMSGLSAGSICWFRYGNSDSPKFTNPEADLIRVTGIGMINALHCPHYDIEPYRHPELKKMMRKISGVAIALDNCCALEVIDDKYRILAAKKSARAYKVYWQGREYREEIIPAQDRFQPLKRLLTKSE
jgi:dipeptidase E